MKAITERQQEVLDFIRGYSGEHGYPPTLRDIGRHFGFSPKAAFDHLRALEKKGFVETGSRVPRGIRIVHPDSGMTVKEYLSLDRDNDLFLIRKYNRALIGKHPYLMPRNRMTGETDPDYDFSWTEMDLMPDGWRIAFGDELLEKLTAMLREHGALKQYRIADIKEKYGSLRWYDFGAPAEVTGMLTEYSKASARICGKCGKPAQWISKGWIAPYCDTCARQSRRPYPEAFRRIGEEG